ncbi:hypothetical protein [Pseudomonas sp. QTF5]|uniref:hypothetical protein n=1 Tax=Pseudomonas sp. QTF5 TaxID=1435425 RepID=UPI0004BE2828|nr:hypothetical protein [Pseudomonas sp. QTF5]
MPGRRRCETGNGVAGKFNGADAAAATPDVTIKLEGNNWSNASINSLIAGSDPTIKVDHNNS